MKNPHIIVGFPRRCVCGSYDHTSITCQDVLTAIHELRRYAEAQRQPSGQPFPPRLPMPESMLAICELVESLVVECGDDGGGM